jgi:DNA-3-methyladenine glycosylase
MQRLPTSFVERDAPVVAPELLNKVLVVGGRRARIVEVEAYTADDPASHSYRGRTARNASMFGPAGQWYVYLVYGLHHCLNLVTGAAGDGQAVLIRSVLVDGVDPARTRGPGRLCRELGVDRSIDGTAATVFDDGVVPPPSPLVTPRIGITRAVERPWRWLVA